MQLPQLELIEKILGIAVTGATLGGLLYSGYRKIKLHKSSAVYIAISIAIFGSSLFWFVLLYMKTDALDNAGFVCIDKLQNRIEEIDNIKKLEGWGNPPRVVLCDKINFEGNCIYRYGYSDGDLSDDFFNNKIQSVKLEGGLDKITLYSDRYCKGESYRIKTSIADLGDRKNWASSVRIKELPCQ